LPSPFDRSIASRFAIHLQIEHVLVGVLEQIVTPVRLAGAIRQSNARAHQTAEILGVLGVEEDEQLDDRLPCRRAPRLDGAAADLAPEIAAQLPARDDRPVQHRVRRDRGGPEHRDMPRQPRGDELDVEPHDLGHQSTGHSDDCRNGKPCPIRGVNRKTAALGRAGGGVQHRTFGDESNER